MIQLKEIYFILLIVSHLILLSYSLNNREINRLIIHKRQLNPCSFLKCLNGGTCTYFNNLGSCKCTPNFTGVRCETIISSNSKMDCSSLICFNGGKCINYLHNSGVCFCPIGYTGLQCQIGTDENNFSSNHITNPSTILTTTLSKVKRVCDIIKCNNGGTCVQFSMFIGTCTCPQGFYGKTCDIIAPKNTISSKMTTIKNFKTVKTTTNSSHKTKTKPSTKTTSTTTTITTTTETKTTTATTTTTPTTTTTITTTTETTTTTTTTTPTTTTTILTTTPIIVSTSTFRISPTTVEPTSIFITPPISKILSTTSDISLTTTEDFNFCSIAQCAHGKCYSNSLDNFVCICDKGYTGQLCDVPEEV